MKNGNKLKTGIICVVLVLICVIFAISVSKRDTGSAGKEEVKTPKDWARLVDKDLAAEYPPTPTSLIGYYSDLLMAYYDKNCDEELFKKLVARSRELYDDELLAKNTLDNQMEVLRAEIDMYKDQKKSIINYTVCSTDDVKYGTLDGKNVATLTVTYRIRTEDKVSDLREEFFVRKDEDNLWKIVGWTKK